jgi:BMFP domain-containing protein YqiC
VYRPSEDICSSRATIYGESGSLKKSRYVKLMVERVLKSIDVVARDDFRQVAVEIANRQKRGEPYESRMQQLRDMRSLSDTQQKIAALLWSTRDRGSHGYSEARLNRCLEEADVESWHKCA